MPNTIPAWSLPLTTQDASSSRNPFGNSSTSRRDASSRSRPASTASLFAGPTPSPRSSARKESSCITARAAPRSTSVNSCVPNEMPVTRASLTVRECALFDTSVLVTALVDQLGNHEAAFRALQRYTRGEHAGCCSTHATRGVLCDPHRVTCRDPHLSRRSTPPDRRLGSRTARGRASRPSRLPRCGQVATLGLASGAVYDALHAHCARKERVNQILTYNLSDFARFDLHDIMVAAP